MQGILNAPRVRWWLTGAALAGAMRLVLQALAFVLLTPTDTRGYTDFLNAAGWMLCLAWVMATVAIASSAWAAGVAGQMRQTPWRVAATVATGVVTVGVFVAVVGGAASDHAPGDALQAIGFVLWALVLLAWMVQRATDAGRLVDHGVDGALLLGGVALLCGAVDAAVPGPTVGDITPAVVGIAFAIIGSLIAVAALQQVRHAGLMVPELGVVQGALSLLAASDLLYAIFIELEVQPSGALNILRAGMAIASVVGAAAGGVLAWAAAPILWDKQPIPSITPDRAPAGTHSPPGFPTPFYTCSNCGWRLERGIRFCPQCGRPVGNVAQPGQQS